MATSDGASPEPLPAALMGPLQWWTTAFWGHVIPMMTRRGGDPLACTFGDAVGERRARLPPEGQRQRKGFEQAYDVALQVIELREKHGLTQAQLAEKCGMDQGDISRIERGATNPTARTLQRAADVLGADLRLVDRGL